MSFLQKIRCFAYRLYDRAKDFWPIRQIFYGGATYQHYNYVATVGEVTAVQRGSVDGDWTFDILTAQGPIHCEITPCYPFPADRLAKLAPGQTVWVGGTRTFDPTHLGDPAHWEIHPVQRLVILA